SVYCSFMSMRARPPRSPLFPYTTLFRSDARPEHAICAVAAACATTAAALQVGRAWAGQLAEPFSMCMRSGMLWGRAQCNRGHWRSEEHTSELQSRENLVCRLLLEKKKKT